MSKLAERGIDILFEDNHLLCAVKPVGILSQSDNTGAPDMLSLLKAYLKEKYNKPGEVYLGLVHRLDKPVGGIMVFAKTSKAAARLCAQIRNHTFVKTYSAVLAGDLPETSGILRDIIVKDRQSNIVRVLPADNNENRNTAVLKYRKINCREGMSLVEVNLVTGKPHQIRAQFANIGFPVIGDRKYKSRRSVSAGNNQDNERAGVHRGIVGVQPRKVGTYAGGAGRGSARRSGAVAEEPETQYATAGGETADVRSPALWAQKIGFDHPVSKERMTIEAGIPEYFPWKLFS